MNQKLATSLDEFNATLAQFTSQPRKPKAQRLNVEQIVCEHLSSDAHVFFDNGFVSSAEIDDDGTSLTIKIRI